MFDRHYHQPAAPSHLTVTEHRAPTDKSVQLLREMEDAARARITASVRLENTVVDAVIHRMDDVLNRQVEYAIMLKINGKQLEIRRAVPADKRPEQIAEILHKAVSDHIAEKLLSDAFRSIRW